MFEEIEKANDGREMVLAPQNHATALVSFIWDTTTGEGSDAPAAAEATVGE